MAKRKQAAVRELAAGAKVSYAGQTWAIAGREGPFVDLTRTDEEGEYEARVMASDLAPDLAGGFTWQENRKPAPTIPDEGGDPDFPLDPEYLDRHQRHARAVEEKARLRFEASPLAADQSWTTITEQQRERFRERVRQSLRVAGRK